MVYGTLKYSLDSNICRAAIHEGAIDDGGGIFTLVFSTVKFIKDKNEIINGRDNNGVQSFDYSIPSKDDIAISFLKKINECPIDKVR